MVKRLCTKRKTCMYHEEYSYQSSSTHFLKVISNFEWLIEIRNDKMTDK